MLPNWTITASDTDNWKSVRRSSISNFFGTQDGTDMDIDMGIK